ncbi:MAG: beta-lactamase family protein [Casimicrobiaceae bacterium]|nr:beta-lactamase family protein [Casimicrobiaceae bacterium]MDW8312958.1 serine hydrolase domain-containing protein [Burkholderiales bacterium]
MSTALTDASRAALEHALAAIVARPGRELASLAVALVREAKVVYTGAFGRAWIDPEGRGRDRRATPQTLYRVASVSKLVVALAVAELCARGVLDPDRDVSDWLGFPLRNPNHPAVPVTLAQLLSHTSSLTDRAGYNFPEEVPLAEVLTPGGRRSADGRAWQREHPPGVFFRYCNLGFGVAVQVMERATGERFDRLMQQLLFGPLGITATFDPATLRPEDRARVATLYRKRPAGDGDLRWDPVGLWVPQVDDASNPPQPRASERYVIGTNGSVFAPQGGLRISVADLARLMVVLVNGGRDETGRTVLSPRTLELCFTERWRFDPRANGGRGNRAEDDEGAGGLFNAWGFGSQRFLDVSHGPGRGDRLVEGGGFTGWGHLGNAYGLTSCFALDPARRAGFIFLSGGTAFDPETERGAFSAQYRYEEVIASALWRAVLGENVSPSS